MIEGTRNQTNTLISLKTAYDHYINLIHRSDSDDVPLLRDDRNDDDDIERTDGDTIDSKATETDDTNTDNDETQPSMKQNNNSLVLLATMIHKHTNEKKSISIIVKDEKCCVCDSTITNTQKYIRCTQCGRKLHINTECEFGKVQYAYRDRIYCSLACHLRQEIYEIAIINENRKTKKYLMKYTNGTTTWLTAKQVENYSQYAKILHDWRMLHPQIVDDDDDVVEIIEKKKDTSNINMNDKIDDENTCCVCKEALSNDNPHTCNKCHRRMHGHIICPQREFIYADDDKLYCWDCKVRM
jgi:hypothetical protein